jgi:TrpR family trp operon transcriptional repressor
MKKQELTDNLIDELSEIIFKLQNQDDVKKFLTEILTPKELSDITLRWQLLKDLNNGKTQRAIASNYGISLCKITRGSKILKNNESIITKILNKDGGNNE